MLWVRLVSPIDIVCMQCHLHCERYATSKALVPETHRAALLLATLLYDVEAINLRSKGLDLSLLRLNKSVCAYIAWSRKSNLVTSKMIVTFALFLYRADKDDNYVAIRKA